MDNAQEIAEPIEWMRMLLRVGDHGPEVLEILSTSGEDEALARLSELLDFDGPALRALFHAGLDVFTPKRREILKREIEESAAELS